MSNLKSKVNKLDVDKLVSIPVDLSKLNDVVKMMLLKRMYMMNWLKMLRIFTSGNLLEKADYNTKIMKLKRKYLIMFMINILLHKNLIR